MILSHLEEIEENVKQNSDALCSFNVGMMYMLVSICVYMYREALQHG